jgi:hypothetical protein
MPVLETHSQLYFTVFSVTHERLFINLTQDSLSKGRKTSFSTIGNVKAGCILPMSPGLYDAGSGPRTRLDTVEEDQSSISMVGYKTRYS